MYSRNASNRIRTIDWAFPALLLVACVLFATVWGTGSSWAWATQTRPFDLLPWAALGALVLEAAVILPAAQPERKGRAFAILCIGNLLAFLLPYALRFLAQVYAISSPWEHYIVGALFLVVTFVVEFPLVYQLLKKDAKRKEWLLPSLLLANVVSTGAVVLLERIVCRGFWV